MTSELSNNMQGDTCMATNLIRIISRISVTLSVHAEGTWMVLFGMRIKQTQFLV